MSQALLAVTAMVVAAAAGAAPARAQAGDVPHGDYLINRVALCGDCHSTHDAQGRVVGTPLGGAPFPGGPQGNPAFAHYAPPIAGLPAGRSAAEVSLLLQTGAYPDGRRLRHPMPQFRWDKDDADAAVAYLGSLGR